jgi:hypothetical protein
VDAHLRYLERDGVTKDGAKGQVYSAEHDVEDGRTFLERDAMTGISSASCLCQQLGSSTATPLKSRSTPQVRDGPKGLCVPKTLFMLMLLGLCVRYGLPAFEGYALIIRCVSSNSGGSSAAIGRRPIAGKASASKRRRICPA